jgi:hypothetical protein
MATAGLVCCAVPTLDEAGAAVVVVAFEAIVAIVSHNQLIRKSE